MKLKHRDDHVELLQSLEKNPCAATNFCFNQMASQQILSMETILKEISIWSH